MGIGTALAVGGQLFSGVTSFLAGEAEAKAIEVQAEIAREESEEEARRLGKQFDRLIATQNVMFLKSGVTLSGSPLLILEETREEKEEQVEAQIRRGEAQFQLGLGEASRVSAFGRSSLIGSIFGAASAFHSLSFEANQAQVFKV